MQAAQQAKSSATQPGAPIKVLHLGYGARGGGVGRALSDLACEMQRRGFECSVIFFGVYPAFSGYMDPLKASDIPTYDLVKTPGLDLRGVRAIGTIVRLERPDVIISHGVAAGAYRLILTAPLRETSRARQSMQSARHSPTEWFLCPRITFKWQPRSTGAYCEGSTRSSF
jgi:hypothetical protein